jgi:inner membrane protein
MEDGGMSIPAPVGPLRAFLNRFGILFKLAIIGILLLLLLIPLSMLESKLNERKQRRDDAVQDITSSWSSSQRVIGPILKVPFELTRTVLRDTVVDGKTKQAEVKETVVCHAYFLPKTLTVKSVVKPELRHRSIYEAVLYQTECDMTGEFDLSEWKDLKLDAANVKMLWGEAVLSVVISDLRGIRENIPLEFGGRQVLFKPGTTLRFTGDGSSGSIAGVVEKGIHATPGNVDIKKTLVYPFAMKLALNGSGSLEFVPVGKENKIGMQSPWPDPNFYGRFLPTNRQVGPGGFAADWQLSYYGRSFGQQWNSTERYGYEELVGGAVFGVEFMTPVDNYRQVERAVKYAVLFIVLVFTAYFLFEVLAKRKIHPFQYILIGAAICLFYLGILSLSEIWNFGWAYLVSSLASWAMISLYTLSVLKSGRKTLIIAALLAFIQAYLYIVLQLQDYSLIFGAALLFVVLGTVMFVTRRVDWYNSEPPPLP